MIKIKNLTDKAEIYIYGVIIDDTDAQMYFDADGNVVGYQFPAEIRKQLEELKGIPIDVHIASDGGDVAAGIAIYNMLKSHDAAVEVYIDSWAASIASVIAFAGNKIFMPENTFLMIHNPRGGGFGESDYLRSIAGWLDKLKDMIANTYASFANVGVEEIKAKMDAETWLTAAECKELFGDKVELLASNEIEAVAMLHSNYKNAPEILKAKAEANAVNSEAENVENNAENTATDTVIDSSENGNVDIDITQIIDVLRRSNYEEEG